MRAAPRYDELAVLERGELVETLEFCEDSARSRNDMAGLIRFRLERG